MVNACCCMSKCKSNVYFHAPFPRCAPNPFIKMRIALANMRDISIVRSQHIRKNAHNARQPAVTGLTAGRPSTQSKMLFNSMSNTPVWLDVPTSNVCAMIYVPHTSCVGVVQSPATLVPLVASVRRCSNNPVIKLLPNHGSLIATQQARPLRVEVV